MGAMDRTRRGEAPRGRTLTHSVPRHPALPASPLVAWRRGPAPPQSPESHSSLEPLSAATSTATLPRFAGPLLPPQGGRRQKPSPPCWVCLAQKREHVYGAAFKGPGTGPGWAETSSSLASTLYTCSSLAVLFLTEPAPPPHTRSNSESEKQSSTGVPHFPARPPQAVPFHGERLPTPALQTEPTTCPA